MERIEIQVGTYTLGKVTMARKIVLIAGMLLVVGVASFDIFPQWSILLQATSGIVALIGFAIGE